MADLQTTLKNALTVAERDYGSPYAIGTLISGLSMGPTGSSDFLGQAFEYANLRRIPLEQGIIEYAERNSSKFPFAALTLDSLAGKISNEDSQKSFTYLQSLANALNQVPSLAGRIPDLNVAKRDLAIELAKPIGAPVFDPAIGGYAKNVTDFQRPEIVRELQDRIARLESTSERTAPLRENLLSIDNLYKSIGNKASYIKPVEEMILQFSPEAYQLEFQQNFVNDLLGKDRVDWSDELQSVANRNREIQARQEARVLNLESNAPTLDQIRAVIQLGLSDSNLNKPQGFYDEYYNLPSTATASDVESVLAKYNLPSISKLAAYDINPAVGARYIPGVGGVKLTDPYMDQVGRDWRGFPDAGIRILSESQAERDALSRSRIGTEYDVIGRDPALQRIAQQYGQYLTSAPPLNQAVPPQPTSPLAQTAPAGAASSMVPTSSGTVPAGMQRFGGFNFLSTPLFSIAGTTPNAAPQPMFRSGVAGYTPMVPTGFQFGVPEVFAPRPVFQPGPFDPGVIGSDGTWTPTPPASATPVTPVPVPGITIPE